MVIIFNWPVQLGFLSAMDNPSITPSVSGQSSLERLEVELLFRAIFNRYGYDFRQYAHDSARRRVLHRMRLEKIDSIGTLQDRVIHDEKIADKLLKDLSINVTEMFRDPDFFLYLRENVLPLYSQKDTLKFWHAGCANGMEAYSMSILLTELGLYENTQLYATDFNRSILEDAKSAIYSIETMTKYIKNYHLSGGKQPFSNYYHAKFKNAVINSSLKDKILFAHHNLTSDACFGEMDMIVCRNVIIYFDKTLQERVFKLFWESLRIGGILCLGSSETLQLSKIRHHFSEVSKELKIYKKIS